MNSLVEKSGNFELDPIQTEAVERAMEVVRKGGAFKLLGKAGTGKTTTGLTILNAIRKAGYNVVCCAYTNKAVNRMMEVGYPRELCRTVHRLLYKTSLSIEAGGYLFTEDQADLILNTRNKVEVNRVFDAVGVVGNGKEDDETARKRVFDLVRRGRGDRVSGSVRKTEEELLKDGFPPNTVVLVDELSMLNMDAADDLHGTFRAVIYMGDPGQLPPVNSVDTCQYLSCDDEVTLTNIHRVAGNERLLDLIYALDKGEIPPEARPIDIDQFRAMVHEKYQFICYTNKGVAWINQEARRAKGLHGLSPQGDEPLITVTQVRGQRNVAINDENKEWFLKNEHRLLERYRTSRGRSGASNYQRENGELLSVTLVRMIQKNMVLRCAGEPEEIVSFYKRSNGIWNLPVTIEGERQDAVWVVSTVPFWDMDITRKQAFRNLGKSMTVDFAYGITAHKAQGSEWSKVAVMLRQVYKNQMGNAELSTEVSRWNYTAATRGREDIQVFTSIIGCSFG